MTIRNVRRNLSVVFTTRQANAFDNAPINAMPEGKAVGKQGWAWGGDLIVFVCPGVGHLTDLVLPGEGIFESFFARRRDI